MPVKYIHQNNAGVAVARNNGIANARGEFIICLDANDRLDRQFVEACLPALKQDPTLGIAYTGLLAVEANGKQSVSQWPPQYDFDTMVYPGGINNVPTACMFRKEMWRRLGGYRSRYCPQGAGSEDADFWLRAGLHGYNGRKVTDAPLFIYSYRTGNVSDPDGSFDITVGYPSGFRTNGLLTVVPDGTLAYEYDKLVGRGTVHEGEGRRVLVFTQTKGETTFSVSKSLP